MKRVLPFLLALVATLCFVSYVQGQITIITDDPEYTSGEPSAVLELKSDNLGLLIPRMTLADRNNITNPATGLLIFQTEVPVGFYYNAGTTGSPDWKPINIQSIADLADVDLTWLEDGRLLKYNAVEGKWIVADEEDPVFSGSLAFGITATDTANWNEVYSWGNHTLEGYLSGELDPDFNASLAAGITATDTANWNVAYSWGDHALEGYLSGELDPDFNASLAAGITATDTANWNEAYNWGDHALEGYLFGELDPDFNNSLAAGITATDTTNWNEAYNWGDHALESYLIDISEQSIGDLIDVETTDVSNGKILKFDGVKWSVADDNNTTYTAGTGLSLSEENAFAVNFGGSGSSNVAAHSDHTHSAAAITSGTFPVARGGTGQNTFNSGEVLIGNGTNGISSLSRNGIDTRANFPPSNHTHLASEITSGTFPVARGGTGLSSFINSYYFRASSSTTMEQRSPTQVRDDIGAAAVSHTHSNLTASSGLSGTAYNGSSPTSWSVLFDGSGSATSAARSDHSHSNLTAGSGLSGTAYNGSSPTSWSVSFAGTGSTNSAARSDHHHTDGTNNVYIGNSAGGGTTTGQYNTALGRDALINCGSGNNRTAIGYNAKANGSNSTAIGWNANAPNNSIILGHTTIDAIGGYKAWSNYSDARLKENIKYSSEIGLGFILQLQTATFNYVDDETKSRHDGLIAQDVQKVMNELGVDFSGLTILEEDGTMMLSLSTFIIPLINAIKEHQNLLMQQQEEINRLKASSINSTK